MKITIGLETWARVQNFPGIAEISGIGKQNAQKICRNYASQKTKSICLSITWQNIATGKK